MVFETFTHDHLIGLVVSKTQRVRTVGSLEGDTFNITKKSCTHLFYLSLYKIGMRLLFGVLKLCHFAVTFHPPAAFKCAHITYNLDRGLQFNIAT